MFPGHVVGPREPLPQVRHRTVTCNRHQIILVYHCCNNKIYCFTEVVTETRYLHTELLGLGDLGPGRSEFLDGQSG